MFIFEHLALTDERHCI